MKNVKLSYKEAVKYATIIFVLVSLMVWILMYFGSSAFIPTGERPHFDRDFNRWVPVIGAIGTYLYLFALFALNFKILESKIKGHRKTIIAIIATVASAILFNIIMSLFMQAVVPVDNLPYSVRTGTLIKDFVFAAIVFFLSLIIYLSSQKQHMILEYEAMKAENARSRFEALKNQLDPHFLFNTFNTLDSLIQDEPEKARNYLQQLSSIFRYVIPNKELTTLEDELKFSSNYTDLMQLRYENSLLVEFNVDERYLCYEIVPLSVQILIENAIKHNVISSESPFLIRITVGPNPTVTVSNEIRPKKTFNTGSGIGLSNLTERFRLKIQKEIVISDTDGVFTVILPLQSPENNIS